MDVAALVAQVRTLIDDEDAEVFSDEEIVGAIAQALSVEIGGPVEVLTCS